MEFADVSNQNWVVSDNIFKKIFNHQMKEGTQNIKLFMTSDDTPENYVMRYAGEYVEIFQRKQH